VSDKTAALRVEGLTVHYGDFPALWDISLTVPRGHLVGIIGPNGAGKTTFIRAVLNLIDRSSGRVVMHGRPLEEQRRAIAYVPQKEKIDWSFPMRLRDLVQMGCYPKRGLFRRLTGQDHEAVDRAIELLHLQAHAFEQIGKLSGGQQQRAFLARAIVQNADLYFLDEPFTGVDHVSEHILMDLLRSMRAEGKTVFIVHHDLLNAQNYFDWAILLNTHLVSYGKVQEVLSPACLRHAYGDKLTLIEDVLQLSQIYSRGDS